MSIATTIASEVTPNTAKSGGILTLAESDYAPITDRLLKNKFQLYKASLQKLTANVKSITPLKPFQLLTDSKQAEKQFVMTAMRYKPCSDMYDVELNEYDNTTDITLNITT